jgi:hypothetical protein
MEFDRNPRIRGVSSIRPHGDPALRDKKGAKTKCSRFSVARWFNVQRWFFMWMPEWLYERLPILYLVASGACLWFLGTSFAPALSALLLFGVALLIFSRRRGARRLAPVRSRRRVPKR